MQSSNDSSQSAAIVWVCLLFSLRIWQGKTLKIYNIQYNNIKDRRSVICQYSLQSLQFNDKIPPCTDGFRERETHYETMLSRNAYFVSNCIYFVCFLKILSVNMSHSSGRGGEMLHITVDYNRFCSSLLLRLRSEIEDKSTLLSQKFKKYTDSGLYSSRSSGLCPRLCPPEFPCSSLCTINHTASHIICSIFA